MNQSYSLRRGRNQTSRYDDYGFLQSTLDEADDSVKKVAGRWTDEEKARFEEGFKIYGKDWKKI